MNSPDTERESYIIDISIYHSLFVKERGILVVYVSTRKVAVRVTKKETPKIELEKKFGKIAYLFVMMIFFVNASWMSSKIRTSTAAATIKGGKRLKLRSLLNFQASFGVFPGKVTPLILEREESELSGFST